MDINFHRNKKAYIPIPNLPHTHTHTHTHTQAYISTHANNYFSNLSQMCTTQHYITSKKKKQLVHKEAFLYQISYKFDHSSRLRTAFLFMYTSHSKQFEFLHTCTIENQGIYTTMQQPLKHKINLVLYFPSTLHDPYINIYILKTCYSYINEHTTCHQRDHTSKTTQLN